MSSKVMIPLYGNDVAPRFDLATEVLIAVRDGDRAPGEEKIMVLSQASSEQLCQLVLNEGIDAVICNGIDEEHFQFLVWKRVSVYDAVIGPWEKALRRFYEGILNSGDNLYQSAGISNV